MNKAISIIGAPVWLGQKRYGVNLAPDTIRSAGIISKLESAGYDVADEGNITVTDADHAKSVSNIRNIKPITRAAEKLANAVSLTLRNQRFPLVIGGDHSIAIGSIAGAAASCRELGVIWFDAHADINTPETSPSGNIHGMPLAVSLGMGHSDLVAIGGSPAKIKPENLIYIGVRDMDAGEVKLINRLGIRVYSPYEVNRRGMAKVVNEALAELSGRCDAIHLSFDLDGIDPAEAPGVGTPASHGISIADSKTAISILAQSKLITSADFVELNPLLDRDGLTLAATVSLISTLFADDALATAGTSGFINAKAITGTAEI